MSYAHTEIKVIQWGEKRGIVQNSNPRAQAEKTKEELQELFEAIEANDRDAMADAYGDILTTIVLGAATADLDMQTCFELAYQAIKDRTGHLDVNGIWVKD